MNDRQQPAGDFEGVLKSLRGFFGPTANAECVETLAVRLLTWRQMLELTPADAEAAARSLMRPAVAARVKFPSDLLAEYAEAVELATAAGRRRQQLRRLAEDPDRAAAVEAARQRDKTRAIAAGIGQEPDGTR